MGILDIVPFRQRRPAVPVPTASDRDPILALRADVDRAFGNFWNLMSLPMPLAMLSGYPDGEASDLRIDVRDNGKAVEIVAELPGLTADDIEVTAAPESITIRAERQNQREERDASSIVLERGVGIVERTIALPVGSLADQATARFKNGALTIVVPKSAEWQSRQTRVEVQAS